MSKLTIAFILGLIIMLFSVLFFFDFHNDKPSSSVTEQTTEKQIIIKGKKVYFLSSYHQDYPDHIVTRNSLLKAFEGQGIEVRFEYLNAKKIKDPEALTQMSAKIREKILTWKPDLLIAADDAINKFLVSPFFKDKEIPVVFIGVNWDASVYGYPADNVTGQVEVELFEELIGELAKYGKDNHIGILTGNTITDQKNITYYKARLKDRLVESKLVDNFQDWKKEYARMQDEVDILILRHKNGIKDWNDKKAVRHVNRTTKIPTGTVHLELKEMTLICFPKIREELGEYAGTTAIRILKGKSPKDIPISQNKSSKIILNMAIAKRMNIKFSKEIMEISHFSGIEKKKVLIINSYHKGYEWSDDIEKGIIKAMELKYNQGGNSYLGPGIVARFYRMDTKINKSEEFILSAARFGKQLIDTWKPDVVIASDDNASKYIISQYYKNATTPFVFCGLNYDAAIYGFPCKNVTGMIEIAPFDKLILLLKKYAKGNRIGLLRADSFSSEKDSKYLRTYLTGELSTEEVAANFEEWKKSYLKLQASTDILILLSQVGIDGWNDGQAEIFVQKNTKIPTGAAIKNMKKLALLSYIRLGEEQGWWAGKTALRILAGENSEDIPVVSNKKSMIFLNMPLAKKLAIKFPIELIEKSTLVENFSD